MKEYIIPAEGAFYKANLHCHSTASDGKLTPEELKEVYKNAGYSVLAYSDHNVLIDHSALDDENFLTLTSVEIDLLKKGEESWIERPCYHINFYPNDQHNTALPCFNPKYIRENHADLRESQAYVGTPDYVRDYEKINEMIAEFAKHGFIAMLNHPTWSVQTMEDYKLLDTEHIFAMEIYNHGCFVDGYDEINCHIYDEMLRRGNKLFCTATDDNHNGSPKGTAKWDSLGGFVMIKAPELTYKAILNALKQGDFYASTGPEIHELYIEDGILHVKTSPAAKIALTTAVRQASVRYPESQYTPICEASFDLSKYYPGYVRITVTDDRGRMAWSQPIYGDFSGKK
ncbi:MAG: PHP domain-containing protein [Clostridia bacterium]|nr:PHP domain-containing protein [Clostridia bacterium]